MIFLCAAIALLATVCGSMTGLGGGVIIKPALDATQLFSASAAGLMSAFTLLTMSCTGIVRRAVSRDMPVDKNTLALAAGSVLGGILGDAAAKALAGSFTDDGALVAVQNIALILCLALVLIYMNLLLPKGVRCRIESCWWGLFAGVVLGAVSAFIGIGGGPVNVAVLCFLLPMDMKTASFNSLVMILCSQGAKIIIRLLADFDAVRSLRWDIVAVMCCAAVAGGLIGTAINRRSGNSVILACYNVLLLVIIALSAHNAAAGML